VSPFAEGKRKGRGVTDKVSLVLHVATLGKKAVLTKPTVGEGAASASFSGYNPSTGRFVMTVMGRGEEGGDVGGVVVRYFGARQKREDIEVADDVVKQACHFFFSSVLITHTRANATHVFLFVLMMCSRRHAIFFFPP